MFDALETANGLQANNPELQQIHIQVACVSVSLSICVLRVCMCLCVSVCFNPRSQCCAPFHTHILIWCWSWICNIYQSVCISVVCTQVNWLLVSKCKSDMCALVMLLNSPILDLIYFKTHNLPIVVNNYTATLSQFKKVFCSALAATMMIRCICNLWSVCVCVCVQVFVQRIQIFFSVTDIPNISHASHISQVSTWT